MSNTSKEATKYDQGKIRYSDIPQNTLKSVAKVFNYGADKYGKYNYSKGMNSTRLYDACQRHLMAWITGEDIDESGNNHLDHAIASLMMLRENIHLKLDTDDRNPAYKPIINNSLPNFNLLQFVDSVPNDYALGSKVREMVNRLRDDSNSEERNRTTYKADSSEL